MTPAERNVLTANEALVAAGKWLDHAVTRWRAAPVPTLWTDVLDAAKAYELASAAYADAFCRCVR
jgi:hypothetical protein